MNEAPDIPGADELVRWFGYWPSFHDAEVLSIELNRSAGVRIRIYAFERTSEVDASGYYVLAKHAIVTFLLEGFTRNEEGITNTRIDFFNARNYLNGVLVEKTTGGYVLTLEAVYGVDGGFSCERMSVSYKPGKPDAPNPTTAFSFD